MKTQKMQPKNQHQEVLFYLYNWNEFSLKDVIVDSMFHKFQTRLSEIETKEMTNIAKRERKEFTNKFGNKGSYFVYSAIDKEQIKQLFEKYNPLLKELNNSIKKASPNLKSIKDIDAFLDEVKGY